MNWIKMEERHKAEWEKFEELKLAAWDAIEKRRKQMYAAFGDHEAKIPMSVFQAIQRQKNDWEDAWGDSGYKTKYLLAIQKRDRDELLPDKSVQKQQALQKIRQLRGTKEKEKPKDRERDD